ncbi:hypothetical protein Taro_032765 [Colocasia esculenta]|uniref:Uncharacterized protein n=1 Tax=Colocasia esculenta TaxID=4460 RepID=A0A843W4W4_COLES|nr:hypothetical protein [Colocasia esculenta]
MPLRFARRVLQRKRPGLLPQIQLPLTNGGQTSFMPVGYHRMRPPILYSLQTLLAMTWPKSGYPSRRLAQPETRVRPDISLPALFSEATDSPRDDVDGAAFSPYISVHVNPAGTVHAASTEPLLSSLLSKDQNVEPMPLVSGAQGGHSREDDVDDWNYELDVTDIPILNPNWDPSMENPEDPNFSVPFDDLMTMMEEPLPTPDRGTLQDIAAVVEPTATEISPFPSIEGTSDQGNPLSVSTSTALNEEKSEPPAPSHPSLDLSVPHEETRIPVKPLSQPSDAVVIGQGDLLPMLDLGETNNNGDDSSVPVPPASDLPAAAKEVEVAIKPSEHVSDVENSEMTSPLDASEPDSSETCMISGYHSESTQPLSGETQQLSITFEAACDVDEVSSRLDRSPRALEVLEDRLAVLCSEAIGTASQISIVRDQHTSILSTQRKQSARADLLRMLASCLDRSVTEDTQHSVALAARLLSLEAEQSRIHAAFAALESEVDRLRTANSCNVFSFATSLAYFLLLVVECCINGLFYHIIWELLICDKSRELCRLLNLWHFYLNCSMDYIRCE